MTRPTRTTHRRDAARAETATPFQAELISRLRTAEEHIRSIGHMVAADASLPEVVQHVRAVRGALRDVNRLLIQHHLTHCLGCAVQSGTPSARTQVLAETVALYRIIAGSLSFLHITFSQPSVAFQHSLSQVRHTRYTVFMHPGGVNDHADQRSTVGSPVSIRQDGGG